MDLCDLLAPDGIIASLQATSKKHALQELCDIAAERTGLDSREIFNTLLQRERLGSTGLGRGIAIPHVKLAGLKRIFCACSRGSISRSTTNSHDNEPVDLIFLLLAPDHASGDHLKALATHLARGARAVGARCIAQRVRRRRRCARHSPAGAFARRLKADPATTQGGDRAARSIWPSTSMRAHRDAADDDAPPAEQRKAVAAHVVEQVAHDEHRRR